MNKAELQTFIHDLFLRKEYIKWRNNLHNISENKWHSLIASLAKYACSTEALANFGKKTYSGLVFSYIKAPDFKRSEMLMVQFTISESLYHQLVWHRLEHSENI